MINEITISGVVVKMMMKIFCIKDDTEQGKNMD